MGLGKYLLLSFVVTSVFWTGSARAVSCESLNDLWARKFYQDFKVNWDLYDFGCPSPSSYVAKAIYDIYKPESRGQRMWDFYEFARKNIRRTDMDWNCKEGISAQMDPDSGVMSICTDFIGESQKVDDVWRASTFIHEAAHADRYDPGHVKCTHGAHKGKVGCDERLNDNLNGSGNNVAFAYLKWVYESTDYQELKRDKIRLTMKYLVLNRFNRVSDSLIAKWAGAPSTLVAQDDPEPPAPEESVPTLRKKESTPAPVVRSTPATPKKPSTSSVTTRRPKTKHQPPMPIYPSWGGYYPYGGYYYSNPGYYHRPPQPRTNPYYPGRYTPRYHQPSWGTSPVW